ncbi:hypothetical protein [Actinomadura rubrisoli]|uniref:Uncharacterized protein n=1 Tax=Actinomadura rubrisoli TaxID=2530368 RepID=A0A4R4ZVR0_9ACTN|nr:hypothetical protein [Actinomadura rubrisoli]TDD62600.1 hypothetical protein E1298_44525 [Actinomadura rubrisoli]
MHAHATAFIACRHPVHQHRGRHAGPAAPRFGDDDLLLFLLTSTWELRTARPAPALPLSELTEDELIEFWSDPADAEPSA